MKKYDNIYTICKFTNKEIFTNDFAMQPLNEFFASLMTAMIMEKTHERIEKAIQNSYPIEDQKKIFYTLGLLLKNYK